MEPKYGFHTLTVILAPDGVVMVLNYNSMFQWFVGLGADERIDIRGCTVQQEVSFSDELRSEHEGGP